jgi:pyrimidine oxygenase
LSENAPQYKPSFALNKEITLKAERYGVDFALSMIKLRGFGGKTEFWDHNLESFTLMAGLAAVTTKIKLFATAASLVMPPAIVARMASTIDSISNGRFGLNLVTGWQRPEYSQMGMWPGDQFFGTRYQYLSEYIQVLRDLWGTGQSDFKGEHFQMDDCRLSPQPQADMKVICAGQSDAGMDFSAKYADYNFCFGKGVNTPKAFAPAAEKLIEATRKTGRHVTTYVLMMVIADETDEAARAKWEHYKAGADHEAIAWLGPAGRGRHQVGRRHQRAPDGRPDLGREHQHGHAGRLLRNRRAPARRNGRGARHRRRAADLRRLRAGRRGLRRAHPAADEEPRARAEPRAVAGRTRAPCRLKRRRA